MTYVNLTGGERKTNIEDSLGQETLWGREDTSSSPQTWYRSDTSSLPLGRWQEEGRGELQSGGCSCDGWSYKTLTLSERRAASSTQIPGAWQITGGNKDDEALRNRSRSRTQLAEGVVGAWAWNNRRDIFFGAENTREESWGEEIISKPSLYYPLLKMNK